MNSVSCELTHVLHELFTKLHRQYCELTDTILVDAFQKVQLQNAIEDTRAEINKVATLEQQRAYIAESKEATRRALQEAEEQLELARVFHLGSQQMEYLIDHRGLVGFVPE